MSNTMIVTIHQPDFLPWLGFFDRWRKSDLYIVLDNVQFLRRGWHHRDKIKTQAGTRWLTVPVLKKGKYHQTIREVEIDEATPWRQKHLYTIEMNYKKAPCFKPCFSKLSAIYEQPYHTLIQFNMALLHFAAQEMGITTPIVFASDYPVQTHSTQRLVDLVKAVGGTTYLTGLGSRDYLDKPLFDKENILLQWQDFHHPVYPQLHGDFIANLSCLDYLMMREP